MGTCGYHLGLVAQLVLHHTLRSPPPQSPHAPRKQVVLRCQLHRTAVRECGLGAVGPHPQALPRAHRGHTLRGVDGQGPLLGGGARDDVPVVKSALGALPQALLVGLHGAGVHGTAAQFGHAATEGALA